MGISSAEGLCCISEMLRYNGTMLNVYLALEVCEGNALSLRLIGSAIFGATFNLVIRVDYRMRNTERWQSSNYS